MKPFIPAVLFVALMLPAAGRATEPPRETAEDAQRLLDEADALLVKGDRKSLAECIARRRRGAAILERVEGESSPRFQAVLRALAAELGRDEAAAILRRFLELEIPNKSPGHAQVAN